MPCRTWSTELSLSVNVLPPPSPRNPGSASASLPQEADRECHLGGCFSSLLRMLEKASMPQDQLCSLHSEAVAASLVQVWRPVCTPCGPLWGWVKGLWWLGQGLAGPFPAVGQTVCRPQEESSPSAPDRLFKIVFVGNSAVGKTSFLRRFCEDRFSPGMAATVGEFSSRDGSQGHLWERTL